jgi:hypothetical protein
MSEQKKGKHGRTGGKTYPRYSLEDLDEHVGLIASKTSRKPHDNVSFCMGIFNLKYNPTCQMKISALKQFGLIEKKEGNLAATELCVRIAARPDDDRAPFYREAFKNVTVFKQALETFSGRTATTSQIATYATDSIGIHLDNKDDFAAKLIESAKKAGLCKEDKEGYFFEPVTLADDEASPDTTKEEKEQGLKPSSPKKPTVDTSRTVTVEVKIDSTLDPETLEKYLEKMKKFGLI